MQSPVLVNRGWVPRSWRDKSVEVSQDDERQSSPASSSAEDNERSSWWRFWSKKPKVNEVVYSLQFFLALTNVICICHLTLIPCDLQEQVPPITPLEVVGVVRGSEKPSIFVPANDPSSCQWFYVDVPAIAGACGLPENTIYMEDINEDVNPSNPYPVPKDINTLIRSSVMPQDHLNYTLTWYVCFT